MKAKVSVSLKRGILDPQGQAVLHALSSLGYAAVKDVRVGKLIELELARNDRAGAEAEVKAMCERLLANTIIEEYRIELME
ncbi:MAG: phosphoribosylformylglycinamidine synthase subunit PurS [Nitrospirae bacterium]|nr:MAG: phosphoribosylformylglycinamidine synthase subunit PurS [Nitrospirota bacterium]